MAPLSAANKVALACVARDGESDASEETVLGAVRSRSKLARGSSYSVREMHMFWRNAMTEQVSRPGANWLSDTRRVGVNTK